MREEFLYRNINGPRDVRTGRRKHLLGLAIFDGDDTLWSTQPLYEGAKQKFALLIRQSGFTEGDVVGLLDSIDAERVATAGYSTTRFRDSMVKTYEVLSSRHGRAPAPSVIHRIQDFANEVFLSSPLVYPEVPASLEAIAVGYNLALLTKGDREVQRRRIQAADLGNLFDALYVVSDKGSGVYRQVLGDFGEASARAWAVGNSIKSDINPALRVGIRGILIKRTTWLYEEAELEHGDVSVAYDLGEAVAIIAERDGAHMLEVGSEHPQ